MQVFAGLRSLQGWQSRDTWVIGAVPEDDTYLMHNRDLPNVVLVELLVKNGHFRPVALIRSDR